MHVSCNVPVCLHKAASQLFTRLIQPDLYSLFLLVSHRGLNRLQTEEVVVWVAERGQWCGLSTNCFAARVLWWSNSLGGLHSGVKLELLGSFLASGHCCLIKDSTASLSFTNWLGVRRLLSRIFISGKAGMWLWQNSRSSLARFSPPSVAGGSCIIASFKSVMAHRRKTSIGPWAPPTWTISAEGAASSSCVSP